MPVDRFVGRQRLQQRLLQLGEIIKAIQLRRIPRLAGLLHFAIGVNIRCVDDRISREVVVRVSFALTCLLAVSAQAHPPMNMDRHAVPSPPMKAGVIGSRGGLFPNAQAATPGMNRRGGRPGGRPSGMGSFGSGGLGMSGSGNRPRLPSVPSSARPSFPRR